MNSPHPAMTVLACSMLLAYVGTLAFLILVRRRGLGFSFRVAKMGFTLGAACIVLLLGGEFVRSPSALRNIFSPTFLMLISVYILPPVLMAVSLWRADAAAQAMRVIEEIPMAAQADEPAPVSGGMNENEKNRSQTDLR